MKNQYFMLGFRSVECPMDLIDQVGGWKSISSIEHSYGIGFKLEKCTKYLTNLVQHRNFIKVRNKLFNSCTILEPTLNKLFI